MSTFSCSFDWLNGVVRVTDIRMFFQSLENISSKLKFENFSFLPWAPRGIRNYNTRLGYQGSTSFVVAYNCHPFDEFTALCENTRNPFVFVSISSQGIGLLSRDEFKSLCSYFHRCGFKASRVDCALDVFERDLADAVSKVVYQGFRYGLRTVEGLPTVCSSMSLKPRFIVRGGKRHRMDRVQIREFPDSNDPAKSRYNVTFGFHDSAFGMFRMYDKYLEQGLDIVPSSDPLKKLVDNIYPDMTWLRLEYELHNEHAQNLFLMFADKGYNELDCWTSTARKMFNIKVAKSDGYQSHFLSISPVWDDFLTSVSTNIHFVQLGKIDSFELRKESELESVIKSIERFSAIINFYCDVRDYDPELAYYIRCVCSSRAYNMERYKNAYKQLSQFDFSNASLLQFVSNSPPLENVGDMINF